MKKQLFTLIILFGFIQIATATHNRAGEITFKWITGYTYRITIKTYTDITPPVSGSSNADRCSLDSVYFGDNTPRTIVFRSNGGNTRCGSSGGRDGVDIVANKIRYNEYTTEHTYPGPGEYIISMEDPNRNGGIINIPSSINQSFSLETLLVIPTFSTKKNDSPILTFPPIDEGCLGKCFTHNPGAYDIDGDSLSYELASCRGTDGNVVPGYAYPATGGGIYSIDNKFGTLTWCSSQLQGEYNLAFIIKEWRKDDGGAYFLIGYVLRDMQVLVKPCNNNSPTIQPITDTCVLAGSTITKTIKASDPDGDLLTMTANGEPFTFTNSPATFNSSPTFNNVVGTFNWNTNCSHIRKASYQISIKVIDNDLTVKLVDFKTFNITVVAPPPRFLNATSLGTNVNLKWNKPICYVTTGNRIIKYCVYRKTNCTPWIPTNCEIGVPAYTGYTKISCTTSINDTTYLDTNNGLGLSQGTFYSYVVVAEHVDGSESYASNQVCVQLKRDVPILINADVQLTSTNAGNVFVRWIKPNLGFNALDTTAITGPYEFRLLHHDNFSGTFSQIYTTTKPYFLALNQLSDTTFVHNTILNTTNFAHTYKVEFYANGQFVGNGQKASTVFLSSTASDNAINLSWVHQVPWSNFSYDVYRKNPSQTTFTLIGTTTSKNYNDVGLVNGAEYCYKIQSKGQYSDPSIVNPLLNFSQELCVKPIDLTPPCSPTITIDFDCITTKLKATWSNPKICSDDVVKYNLYYAETENDSLNLFKTFNSATDTVFVSDDTLSVAGCYQITAIDSFGNESLRSAKACADNCPEYELPNVITLNGDGVNDFFKPIKNKYVKDIDLKMYNRWGNLVFETNDSKIMWDGKSQQLKATVSDGTYFYVCQVNQIRLSGIEVKTLKGFLQVFHK